jgi:hypothetical protein
MAKKDTNPKISSSKENNNSSTFKWFDNLVDNKSKPLLILFLCINILGSVLLFDVKLSIGGDDSYYILRAFEFLKDGKFPTFQGPLYPMLLSLPVAVWGINVPLLKSFSILFMALHVFLFFKTFKGKVPGFVLIFSTLFISFHSSLIYYSSQTYTEAFYFFIQSALLFVLINSLEKLSNTNFANLKSNLKQWLLAGLLITACVLTKNVAFGLIGGFIAYFLFNKKWLAIVLTVVSLAVFYIPFEMVKKTIWKVEGIQAKAQGDILLYKDPYDQSKGKEDLSGFIGRVFDNADIYLSKHLMHIYNLKKFEDIELSKGSTFLITAFLILAIIGAWKQKNNTIKFIWFTCLSSLFIIFLVLQTKWDSERLFIITVPYIVLLHLYAFYYMFSSNITRNVQIIPVIISGLLSFILVKDTLSNSSKNFKALKKNLAGDKYFGYTDDYRNMLLMSEWCGKNLKPESNVMSRKAGMSRIYANGKNFSEIYKVPSQDADSLINNLQERKITHILHASLRRNPYINDGQIITTTYNYLAIILNKYPTKFKLVHQIGDAEPAFLYELQK